MNENLTILKKGLVLVTIPFLAQLGFIGLLLRTSSGNREAQRMAFHSKEVIAKAETAFRRLVEVHSDMRGYVLTANPSFIERAERARRSVPGDFDTLGKLVSDNPVQYERVRQIAAKAQRLFDWQNETARFVREGNQAGALERVKSLAGKAILDDIRSMLDEFFLAESRLEAERTENLTASMEQQRWSLLVGVAFSILGVLVLGLVFARGITQRFGMLAENARRLGEGKELARPLSGRDEIAQLDRVFHRMAHAIAEKNRENEMFIYSVSHDLRSPLVNLQGFSQELGHSAKELRQIIDSSNLPVTERSRVIAIVNEDIGGSIRFIQTAVSRLSAIIDALLRLSRAGRLEYRWQPVDMESIVKRVVDALKSSIVERGAQVTIGKLPPAWGDPTAIEQIFANLIVNAVNYLDPERPGVIEIGTVAPQSTSLHTYFVKDNGRGIPESGIPKLFYAFQRFHDNASKGEGIGLALVRRIVDRHGGKMKVESQVGVGSTFFVELPSEPHAGDRHGSAQVAFGVKEGSQ